MNFTLWILAEDRHLVDRWYRLFTRESWHVQIPETLEGLDSAAQSGKGMALVEVGLAGMKAPKDLQAFSGRHGDISVIVFSRREKMTNTLISGFLEAGADDFITPDIDERVLLSKTRAHLRRMLPTLTCAKTLVVSQNGDIELDRVSRVVKIGVRSKKPESLSNFTPKEFEIFSLLLCNENQVVSRNLLMEEIWKEKSGKVNVETVDKHIETLRHKLGACGKHIRTIYGAGYSYKSE
ncbi:MAG TPA: response regulator transcription factor [Elusimicrobiales bacterium]|nr:response regulator transcription factor [Elusimicrobiales bacterium]